MPTTSSGLSNELAATPVAAVTAATILLADSANVRRYAFDGTLLATPYGSPLTTYQAGAYAPGAGYLFLGAKGNGSGGSGGVRRIVLATGTLTTPIASGARGVAVDEAAASGAGRIFYGFNNSSIFQAALDGTGAVALISGGHFYPSAVACVPASSRLYFTKKGSGGPGLYRTTYAGATPVLLKSTSNQESLSADLATGNVYLGAGSLGVFQFTPGDVETDVTPPGLGSLFSDVREFLVDSVGGYCYGWVRMVDDSLWDLYRWDWPTLANPTPIVTGSGTADASLTLEPA